MKKGLGVKMKPSGIGGMAVMEGVMMKHEDEYAVAVRKPNNEIVVEKSTYTDFSDKVKLFKLPIFRGMLALVQVVVVGVKGLNFSASFFDDEEEIKSKEKKSKGKSKIEKSSLEYDDDFEIDEVIDENTVEAMIEAEITKENKVDKKSDKSNVLLTAFAVLLSIVLSVALFMVLPIIITNMLSGFIPNKYTLTFIEGMLRLIIFIGYVLIAARIPEIRRVSMYHGAEHKAINCLEQGFELTVANVKGQSKRHKRCETSFVLLVIIISVFFFILLPVDDLVMRIVSRVLLVPIIAGVCYEFIRLAGKSQSRLAYAFSLPGLWMQGLTTKEPDDEMIEVAIQSVGAIFDWKTYLVTSTMDDKHKNDYNTNKVTSINTYSKEKKEKNTTQKRREKNATEQEASATKEVPVKKDVPVEKKAPSKKEAPAKKEAPVEKKAPSKKEAPAKKEALVAKETSVTKETTAIKETSVIKEAAATKESSFDKKNNRNQGITPIPFKPIINDESEEEDDEILRALDKFFDGHNK
ncbi:MAG: hypothetical protein K0S04_423 [Herbinix sp.]|jgi:uncharacterized protein YqhQ|nr:hypothetical protein [Herbinix sp.]